MNYCTSCGKQLQGESKFCTKCGAEQSTQKLSMEKVQCEQCHSVNVQVQVKNAKNPIMLGCALILGGLGIWVLGLLGAIGGVLIGRTESLEMAMNKINEISINNGGSDVRSDPSAE